MSIQELYKIFEKYPIVSTDSRNIPENSIFFALKGGNFNGNEYAQGALDKGAKYSIVDEKKYATQENIILVDDVLKTLQDLASYHRDQLTIPVIGITGTNGKTTSKELMREALSAKYKVFATEGNFNNHIGVPLSLLSIKNTHEIAIIEMGANHEGEIAFLCNIAKPSHGIITNVGKAHLEGFGSFEGVVRTKSELYYYLLKNNGEVFVNASDEHLMRMASRFDKIITYGGGSNDLLKTELLGLNPFVDFQVENNQYTSHMLGEYNFSNISASLNIAHYFNVDTTEACKKIEEYKPANNRSEIKKIGDNTIILDAYNANPTSMEAAINSFAKMKAENKILILGDMFELGEVEKEEHQNIVSLCQKHGFNTVFLCGEAFSNTENKNYNTSVDVEELGKNFSLKNITDTLILVKGSRGMKLETLFN